MANLIKPSYRATNQTLTITLASLANAACQSSAAVDNTANLDLEVLVVVKVKSGAASTSATGYVNVYAYGSADGGVSYPEGAGTNAALTLTSPTNLKFIGSINVVANATTYQSEPFSVSAAFNGVMPDHWGIAVENKTGGTLDSTAGNHAAFFAGIQDQII